MASTKSKMINTIDLLSLYQAQKQLDEVIQKQHKLTYAGTRNKRILALLVELAELANETRCFKFWSIKGPSHIDIIKDEYADALHFFLSLGIDINSTKTEYQLVKMEKSLDLLFTDLYILIAQFIQRHDTSSFENAFAHFLNMMLSINITKQEAINAYFAKLEINHKRQKDHY
jgi:dimeric dUTPase (all-alpha-NTP-PPase superfamily)